MIITTELIESAEDLAADNADKRGSAIIRVNLRLNLPHFRTSIAELWYKLSFILYMITDNGRRGADLAAD